MPLLGVPAGGFVRDVFGLPATEGKIHESRARMIDKGKRIHSLDSCLRNEGLVDCLDWKDVAIPTR